MHLNGLLHISTLSQETREENPFLVMFLEKISKIKNSDIFEYELKKCLSSPVPSHLTVSKKEKFLHHCCSSPLMQWSHNKDNKQDCFSKKFNVFHILFYTRKQKR